MRGRIEGGHKTRVSRAAASYRIGFGRSIRFKDIDIEALGWALAVVASGVAVMLAQEVRATDSVRQNRVIYVEVGCRGVGELAGVGLRRLGSPVRVRRSQGSLQLLKSE